MRSSAHYNRLESMTYEFSEYEVKEALMEKYKIKPGHTNTFELGWSDEDGTYPTKLVVQFQSPDSPTP